MHFVATILPYAEIVLSIILVTLILLQQSDADLGGAFGGSDNLSTTPKTRRGGEKVIYNSTIIVAVIFVLSTFAALIIK